MRPRVFPAEDAPRLEQPVTLESASMRPRVFPAEDFKFGFHRVEVARLQ